VEAWFGGYFGIKPNIALFTLWSEKYHSYFDREGEGKLGKDFTLGVGKLEYWGEKYACTFQLHLFLLNAETGKAQIIENIPDDYFTLVQPIFLLAVRVSFLLFGKATGSISVLDQSIVISDHLRFTPLSYPK